MTLQSATSYAARTALALTLAGLSWALSAHEAVAEEGAVAVRVTLDSPTLTVGQTTTLRVFAQIHPSLEAETERIFSWYIDLVNRSPAIVTVDWATLSTSASDNISGVSGTGSGGAAERRGIHDSFLDTPGAGHGSPIELLAVEVTALRFGTVDIAVELGTGGMRYQNRPSGRTTVVTRQR